MARYRSTDNMAATGAVIGPVELPKDKACMISIQTDANNDAAAVLVLEFSEDGATYITLAAVNPADDATVVLSYTGVSKAGYVRYPRAHRFIRARRTDAAAGVCNATLSISPC